MMRLNELIGQVVGSLKGNPNVANNPMAQGMLDVLESGDASKGEQMADNLCQSMGVTRDEAMKQAKAFFNIP